MAGSYELLFRISAALVLLMMGRIAVLWAHGNREEARILLRMAVATALMASSYLIRSLDGAHRIPGSPFSAILSITAILVLLSGAVELSKAIGRRAAVKQDSR